MSWVSRTPYRMDSTKARVAKETLSASRMLRRLFSYWDRICMYCRNASGVVLFSCCKAIPRTVSIAAR